MWKPSVPPQRNRKCALCAEEHRTEHHKCPVEGCIATRGVACVHVIAKCPNCRGPHGARSSQCPRKKEAQEAARGWRGRATVLPPPPPPPSPATAPPPSSSPGTPDSETPETTQLATAEGDEDQDMGEDFDILMTAVTYSFASSSGSGLSSPPPSSVPRSAPNDEDTGMGRASSVSLRETAHD